MQYNTEYIPHGRLDSKSTCAFANLQHITRAKRLHLCDVDQQGHVVIVSPQVILLDQVVHALLDHRNVRFEMVLHGVDSRRLELLVWQLLLSLHDSHDCSVEGIFPVSLDKRLGTFCFLSLRETVSDALSPLELQIYALFL